MISPVRRQNSNLGEKIVGENKHVTLSSNWCVVSKPGYYLLAAYSIRDDVAAAVKAISKRTATDQYTVIVDAANSEIDLHIIWCKK